MIGIAEMFSEFSQPDEFQVAAQLELFAWRERRDKRDRERIRYRIMKSIPLVREARAQYQREWDRQNARQKRESDVEWVRRRREYQRTWVAARRAQSRRAA